MPGHVRIRLLLITAVAVIAAAVWLAGERQRDAANGSFAEVEAAQALQESMLDQEVGFYGYLNTGRAVFLQRYEGGRRRLETAFARAEEGSPEGEAEEREAIAEQRAAAIEWQRLAEDHLSQADTRSERTLPAAEAAALERSDRKFRMLNAGYKREVIEERDVNQRRASVLTAGLIVLLSAVFGGLGYGLFERRARRDQRRRVRHARFTEVLQLARTEGEAYGLVKRYLERTVPRSTATVLNRNNSANRLEASTSVEGTPLAEALAGAEPESCLAIRGGRMQERREGESALLECEICGASGTNATCIPSLVGGEVIGSVLIEHPQPFRNGDAAYLASSIAEAAPIVANLRNLAIAEHRAETDALTGLPNSRSVYENIKRMAAHSNRTGSPLAAVLFDLDHFKQVNDTYGHSKGDEVLAAIGAIAQDSLRGSDFVGRYGGEEFLALLPDTGCEGAVEAAEKLREAIAAQHISGINRRITASFGVAVMPDEAREADELVRMADRALYLAKATGRNRVETLPDESEREADPVGA